VTVSEEWFAARLRELRSAAGLSRKDLAERAGFKSEAGVRDLEQGLYAPSWSTVVALCQAMGLSCDRFMPPASALPGKAAASTGAASGSAKESAGRPAGETLQKRPRGRPKKDG
jgi:transcriptional regulator with XRE-family HTH domain